MRKVISVLLVKTMRVLTGITARWKWCEPDVRPRIYYANHSSHLDALVIWTSLPKLLRKKTRPVAARDYWNRSALRRYISREIFNALLIDREGGRAAHDSLQEIMKTVENGHSLIFFPEGTRGDGYEIGEFKSGLYHVAKTHREIELIPVYLENLSRVLPKGDFLPVPLLGSATFGRPIQFMAGESRAEFLNRARSAIEELRNE